MRHHRTPEWAPGSERLDGTILGLLVDRDQQRPWSEDEIARAIGGHTPVLNSLERLHRAGLIHRWDEFVSATNAAVHLHDITQYGDCASQHEWVVEHRVLELLLTASEDDENLLSEKKIWRVLRATKKCRRLAITDALSHLDGAGLVDRCDQLVTASDTAIRFDRIMTL